jgi:hypothetical protein
VIPQSSPPQPFVWAETKIAKVGQWTFDFTKWAIKKLKRRFLESKFFAANLI